MVAHMLNASIEASVIAVGGGNVCDYLNALVFGGISDTREADCAPGGAAICPEFRESD